MKNARKSRNNFNVKTEGLNTVKYEKLSVDYLPTYTHILIDFPGEIGFH